MKLSPAQVRNITEVQSRPHSRQRSRHAFASGRRAPGSTEAHSSDWLVHATKPYPWRVKAANRRRNRIARASRKANRRRG